MTEVKVGELRIWRGGDCCYRILNIISDASCRIQLEWSKDYYGIYDSVGTIYVHDTVLLGRYSTSISEEEYLRLLLEQ